MPSPFPGMDPYLENPEVFPDLHGSFITNLKQAIQPLLPEPYYATSGRRTWVEMSERFVEPDVNVTAEERPRAVPRERSGGVAVLDQEVAEAVVIHVPHDEFREQFLEIYHGRRPNQRLVTSIELLSPTNKRPNSPGRDLYLRKQKEMLQGEVHLIEIDLLRGGAHTTAVPLKHLQRKAPKHDYHVCIHRFDRWEDYLVFPILLEQRLPSIPIPLLPEDGEIAADLQSVFDQCYDGGPYSREIAYRVEEPVPPLTAPQSEWARRRLEASGSEDARRP